MSLDETLRLLIENAVGSVVREEIRTILREELAGLRAELEGRLAPPQSTTPTVYLTVDEAAARARSSPKSIRRWLHQGHLRGYRAGRALRIRVDELDAYLARTNGPRVKGMDRTSRASDIAASLLGDNGRRS